MRLTPLLVLLLAPLCAAQPTIDRWIVIGPVDQRGRRPFNPDRVFHRYLLDRNAPPPNEGDRIGDQHWREAEPNEKGRIGGDIAYAYAQVRSAEDTIVIARAPGAGRLYVNGDAFIADVYGTGHSGVPVPLRKGVNHVFVRGVRGAFALTFHATKPGLVTAEEDRTVPHGSGPAAAVHWNVSMKAQGGFAPLGVRKIEVEPTLPAMPEDGKPYRVTFRSRIDNSIQYYAVLPPREREGAGIVLSLHGAGVEALNQARSYSRKKNLWIVAPTNRRPFGFDWQDWGRKDAYEVLAHALQHTGAERSRVYLTGHSMGGHGTWHIAANDPDRFLAIAPSAGWASFDTYVGRPSDDNRTALWQGADGSSLTLNLIENLVQIPTFILHGQKDDNVPMREAVLMETLLVDAGANPRTHYQPGAGHWWNGTQAEGADCVDWPGIFELFARYPAAPRPPQTIEFTSVDPGVDADHHGLHLHQPLRYGEPMHIRAKTEQNLTTVTTRNVRRFRAAGTAFRVDGQMLAPNRDGSTWFMRAKDAWRIEGPQENEKSPERSGPFKRAFDHNFVFVYGDDEDMARARFDAQAWLYRANGDVEVVSAYEFLEKGFAGRNVILYGNATTNRAWKRVFPDSCPVHADAGVLTVGDTVRYGEDWACVFVYPRRGEPTALAAAFARTGTRSARLGYALLPFVSGVGYPDYAVFSSAVLLRGDGGVAEAGWFEHDWSLAR